MTQQLIGPSASMSAIVDLTASAPVPTAHGTFELRVYRAREPADHGLSNDHLALVMGDVAGAEGVPVRVHSECLTSEVFGSLKCDCKGQLDRAMAEVARRGVGVIVYLRQEGRGIGLANKIRAYALQAQGADTIEANERLHLPVDARQYDIAAAMLRQLGVVSVELMTNNPEKVSSLRKLGINVVKRIPTLVAANPHSADYLEVKKRRMQHELPSGVFEQPPEPDEDAKS
ncbi:MAG: GTP cyclohydrolase II [Polyangiaceae bacterium]